MQKYYFFESALFYLVLMSDVKKKIDFLVRIFAPQSYRCKSFNINGLRGVYRCSVNDSDDPR